MSSLRSCTRGLWAGVFCLVSVLIGCSQESTISTDRVSRFGEYSGYSEARFDGWNRYSEYVPTRDGGRVALDFFLPTASGVEAAEPLPVILHYTRYIRARESEEGIVSRVDRDPVLQHMLRHGYAVAVADTPGSGASFGRRELEFSAEEGAAAYDVIEWLAAQTWSDGNIGMHGRSYPGITQYHAALQSPPHLKAVFAEMAGPSLYDFVFRGGTFKEDFINVWGEGTKELDLGEGGSAAPVDADEDGSMRDAAVAEHAGNGWAQDVATQGVYRDWTHEFSDGESTSWRQLDTIDNAAEIDASGVAVYHLVGWFDIYTTQQAMLFANLESAPQKMLIGPWTHSGGYGGRVHLAEFHRWYDHWLKDIDNGVMAEAPVHYWLMRSNNTVPAGAKSEISADELAAEDGSQWRTATQWPPSDLGTITYYLSAGPSGSVASINDGGLVRDEPGANGSHDEYTVDYSSTSGSFNRWKNGYGAARAEPEGTTFFDERTPENEKALTYTSAPLTEELVVVGYPVIHLWVASTHADADFFVYLEEVDAEGRSHYVTEGALRASFRKLGDAPWNDLGLPFHRGHEEDLAALPDRPTELVLDLMGTAIVIDPGHRLRLTITGADADNHALYPDPNTGEPTMSVYREGEHSSWIELPVLGLR